MKDLSFFAIQFLGIPFKLTESNLKNYLFYGYLEGYTIKELKSYIGLKDE